MKPSLRVVVILVNWNGVEDTLECVASLRASSYQNYRIIVVDNGSSDDSVQRLRLAHGDLVLLEAARNLGFTGGNNLGIEYALAHGADYVWLLNNDTVVASDALEKMLQVAEGDARIGIVSAKILFYAPKTRIWFGGAEYNARYMSPRALGYGVDDRGQFDRQCDIPWATGCAMFIRRSVIESIGFLCDDFFLVMEDLDYSLRATAKGYRIVYAPSAIVWHKESMSAGGRDAPQYVYYQTRNFLLLHSRWARSITHLVIAQAYAILYFCRRALEFAVRGRWRSIVGIVDGIRDGLAGFRGPRARSLPDTK